MNLETAVHLSQYLNRKIVEMNGKKRLAISFFVMLTLAGSALAADIIRLSLPLYPPFVQEENGIPVGTGVDFVTKVLDEVGLKYTYELAPNYGRAVADTKLNTVDGFFLATRNAERDEIAVLSAPVVINKWSWFFPASKKFDPKDPKFKSTLKVGVHLNSNPHKWLMENGYNVGGAPTNLDALLKMQDASRVDVVFAPELVYQHVLKKAGRNPEEFTMIVEKEQPFGIYVSKNYLSRYPGLMKKIDVAIIKVKSAKP